MTNKLSLISWIPKKVRNFDILIWFASVDGTNVDNWEMDELSYAVGEFISSQKQQYLVDNVLTPGYDQQAFADFMNNKKGKPLAF